MENFRVLIVYPNLSMMLTPSYAVGLFTSILKKEGYKVDIFDCTPYIPKIELENEPLPVTRANKLLNSRKFDPYKLWGKPNNNLEKDFEAKLHSFKPDAAIISTVVEDTWPQAKELIRITRDNNIKAIVGGVFPTMAPEIVINDELVEIIGIGEGENTVIDFCKAVKNHGDLSKINGTWYKGINGIKKNPLNPVHDINSVIPDFSLFDEKRFLRPLGAKIWKAIPLETIRGCPYSCTYCNSPTQRTLAKERGQGIYFRRNNMGVLKEKIDFLINRHNPNFFYINDDVFMARPEKEIFEFVELYQDYKIPFWFQTRFEDINYRKLEALKEVGCYRISFGVEHGNEKFRKEYIKRNLSNEFIIDQAKVVDDIGIPYTLNVIIGFPYETRELAFETIDLCKQINYDALSVNIFVPYHGTPLREMAIEKGWLDENTQTTSVIGKSILNMDKGYLSSDEIWGLQRTFPLYVKLNKSFYENIKIAEIDNEDGNAAFNELSKTWYDLSYGLDETERMLTYAG